MAMRINGIPYTEQDVADYPWLNERQSNGAPMPSESTGTAPAAASRAIRETDTERFSIDYIQRVLIPGEKEWARKMDRFFISQRNRMQDNVDALLMGETKSLVTKQTFKGVSVEAILLSVADENKSLKQIFSPLIKMQLLRSEAKLKEELGGLVQWHVTDPLVDMYVANRKSEIESINTTTMQMAGKKIGIAVEESIAEGETTAQAAKRIKAAIADVGEIRRNQSVMIARTETGIVTNESRFDAMNAEGIEYMEWITAADDKVRHTHLEAGQAGAVRVGENFPGVNMPYPLYSFGDPGEIINCRCVAVAIEKE
jgi:uncharacterized protein with gpF-like domain